MTLWKFEKPTCCIGDLIKDGCRERSTLFSNQLEMERESYVGPTDKVSNVNPQEGFISPYTSLSESIHEVNNEQIGIYASSGSMIQSIRFIILAQEARSLS